MTERCGIADIAALPDSALPMVRVVVANVEGSTPREAGAAMLVTREGTTGTIGGGQLEFEAIAHARALLNDAEVKRIVSEASTKSERSDSVPLLPLTHPPAAGALSREGERADSPPLPSSALSLDGRGRREAPGEGGAALRGRQRADTDFPGQAMWSRDMRAWPLGPSLGQCCGGAVRVLFEHFGSAERRALAATAAASLVLHPVAPGEPHRFLTARQDARDLPLHIARVVSDMLSGARPRQAVFVPARKGSGAYFIEPIGAQPKPLFIYGAGHVGRAIVRAIAELDFAVSWVDVNKDRFPSAVPDAVRQIIAQDPAAIARTAPEGAYHLVLTYSHALDLAICHALLSKPTFGFLGLIGSGSKRARFMKRLGEGGIPPAALARLTCPIGIGALHGKEPATIAISVAAQLIEQLERECGANTRDEERKLEPGGRISA